MADLPAGRELDALIADKVMKLILCPNWEPINLGSAGGLHLQKMCTHKDKSCVPWRDGFEEFSPRYSTDIASAWEVVEKLRPKVLQLFEYPQRWEAGFGLPLAGWTSMEPAETAPLAICRAALKAVGYEA
jgi:ABA sandwich protein